MNGDLMGAMARAWLCAGCGAMIDETLGGQDGPYVLLPEDERPVLCLPPGRRAAEYEVMFGWAIAETRHQRDGWLALLRGVIDLTAIPDEAA